MRPIVVHAIEPGRALTVFRIVRSDDLGSALLLDSLRSHYELGRPPRGPELEASVLHMGLSAHTSFADSRATAQRFRKLGSFVAEVRLTSGRGFNYAATGKGSHLTVWGDPIKLCEAVVAISEA
jgi:hypothetical protein